MSELEQVIDEAYAAWELNQFEEAARLFQRAARFESAAAKLRLMWAAPDRTVLYEARYAFCLWQAGQSREAEPILLKVARFDWQASRLWGDRGDWNGKPRLSGATQC